MITPIFYIVHLLPFFALGVCAYEDYKTRKVSAGALGCLAASYLPVALYTYAGGMYEHPVFWVCAVPSIVVWGILLFYGFATGRGGADRFVILAGASVFSGSLFALVFGYTIFAAYIAFCHISKIKMQKFPYIVGYWIGYGIFCLPLLFV